MVGTPVHGEYLHPLHGVWRALKQRCLNENCKVYKNYGGRGITLCSVWHHYIPFSKWAFSHGYKLGLTLDRIDNEKGYYPENCRWISRALQLRNTRRNVRLTAFGETKLQVDWIADERCVTTSTTFRRRLEQGWSVEQALSTLSLARGKGA